MSAGVVTGLTREADCLSVIPIDERPPVRCSGARPEAAARAAESLINLGCKALVSFGMAGGLEPSLAPGALVVADTVVGADGQRFNTASSWRAALAESLQDHLTIAGGPIAGSDHALTSPTAKAALHAESGAVAVDMESHKVAAVADASDVPFLVVRAVSDPCTRSIPGWVLNGVGADGHIRYGAMAAGLVCHPWDIPAVIGLSGESNLALDALRRVCSLIGPRFGLP